MSGGEEAVVHRDPVSGLDLRLYVAVGVVLGLAFLVAGLRTGTWPGVLLAGSLWGMAGYFHLVHYVRPRPDKRVGQELGPDGVRILMRLRPQRLLALLCLTVTMMMLFTAGLLLTESTLWRTCLVTLQVVTLVFAPDSVRGLVARDRGITLTPRGLTYRGWSFDAEVAWEEIVLISVDPSNVHLPCIRVDVLPVGGIRARRHRLLLWLEPPPQPGHIKIPTVAVDHPMQLIGLARHLVDLPAQLRHAYLAAHGLAVLTRQSAGTGPSEDPGGLR